MAGAAVLRWRQLLMMIERRLPDKALPFWRHAAGPQTIFFWAPAFKWGLVVAGLADVARPPENLSAPQSGALAATGIIWSRYSLVIIPVNYQLLSVNTFVAMTGLLQLFRIFKHRQSLKHQKSVEEEGN